MNAIAVTGAGVACPWAEDPEHALHVPTGGAADGAWFDVAARLGGRGYKYLPAASQYLLAAARAALRDAGGDLERTPPERRAATTGTNSGAAPVHEQIDRELLAGGPDALSPMLAPYFSINLIPGRLATESRLKGFSLTLTTPRVAGLEAIEAAHRAISLGRADLVLAGAAEAPPPIVAGVAPEAGAGVLVLEREAAARERGARVRGTCQIATCFISPSTLGSARGRAAAALTLDETLARLGAEGEPAWVTADGSHVAGSVAASLERRCLTTAARPAGAGCLRPLLDVAGLLAAGGGPTLLAASAPQGNVALVRVVPAANAAGDLRSRGEHVQFA